MKSFQEQTTKMLSRLTKTLILLICVVLCGCPGGSANVADDDSSKAAEPKVTGPLRILVIDDQPLASILQREWQSLSDNPVELVNESASNLLSQLDDGLQRLDYDVVVYPPTMLGQLTEQKLLRTVPQELIQEPEFRNTEIFRLVRLRETQWNRQVYAVPLGSPVPVLLRRTDLVPDAPSTWKELNATVKQLESTLPAGVTPLAEPLADGWASRMLVTRAAGYMFDSSRVSGVFNYTSMEPRIAGAPFQRALEELSNAMAAGPHDLNPATALALFLDGKAAMAITWPGALPEDEQDAVEFPVAISELPGADERYDQPSAAWRGIEEEESGSVSVFGYDGRLGSVSRGAKNPSLASIFLAWAASNEHSGKLCPRSQHTGPFRRTHEADAVSWSSRRLPAEIATQYTTIQQDVLSRNQAYQCLRIPGEHRYQADLSEAVLSAVRDEVEAATALQNAAATWQKTTDKYGRSKQKTAYRKSLGINID